MPTTHTLIAFKYHSHRTITLLLLLSFFLRRHATAVDLAPTTTTTDPPSPPPSLSSLSCHVDELKLRAANLELLLEATQRKLDSKDAYIANCEKKIEVLDLTIDQLVSDLVNVEEAPDSEQMIRDLEEQVPELEAVVRSNDRELRQLKVRTKDADDRVDLLASQVKEMSVIVPELWFHVQKLEQAQEVIERRTAELRRYMRNQKCLFFKFMNQIFGQRYLDLAAAYTSKAVNCLGRSLLSIKKYHHQVQGFVRQEMGKHDFTAVLAGEESVFFLASFVFVFPIMVAWICLSSNWI